eukprot:gene5963-9962_t
METKKLENKTTHQYFAITPEDLIELSREETVPKKWYEKSFFEQKNDAESKKSKFLKRSEEQHHKLIMLWIKATKSLSNINQLTQPDRVCVLFLRNIHTGMYFELGRTEIQWDNTKPVWTTPILINKEHCMDTSKIVYKYEDDKIVKKIENPDNLKFGIFDVNEPKYVIGNDDLLGTVSWKLSELIDSEAYEISLKPILGDDPCGEISVIEEYANPRFINAKVRLRVTARLNKSIDGFLVIKRIICGNKELRPIYTTETITKSSKPYWNDVYIPMNQWCNGDLKAKITFELWNHGSTLKIFPHKYLAECEIDTLELLSDAQCDYPLIHEKSINPIGYLTIMRFETIPSIDVLMME